MNSEVTNYDSLKKWNVNQIKCPKCGAQRALLWGGERMMHYYRANNTLALTCQTCTYVESFHPLDYEETE